MDNAEVARIFDEVADLLEIQNESPFRVRAYRQAARTVQTLGESVVSLANRGPKSLTELPGIGKDLAGKIIEIVHTGELTLLKELVAQVPETLTTMMRVANVGPKRARLLYDKLGLKTLDELEQAAKSGRIRGVRGFGELLEAKILQGCREHKTRASRWLLAEAEQRTAPLLDYLRKAPGLFALEVAGSYRRRRETVGDVDILAASDRPEAVTRRFLSYSDIGQVLAEGATKCSIRLGSGLQVDLRVVPPDSFGAALLYFTGSKAHNVALRTLAVRKELKLSEYGVFRGDKSIAGKTEDEVFRALGVPWIAPELREDRGEIDAAREGRLPKLVEVDDIRGDLHVHTTYTDGVNSLEEMIEGCVRRGYEYVAITDHSRAVRVAGGLDAEGYRRQAREIAQLRSKFDKIIILRGAEVDILEDGRLDLDEETLADLDIVIAAVHSKLDMEEGMMTRRILRALSDPNVDVLGHPTGRLLGRRDGYAVDMAQIVRAARDKGVMLEINSQPDRLDLDDVHARMARDEGARLVVNTDAHRIGELDAIRYGVDQARRGWCTAFDVANTRPLAKLRSILGSKPLSVRAERQAALESTGAIAELKPYRPRAGQAREPGRPSERVRSSPHARAVHRGRHANHER